MGMMAHGSEFEGIAAHLEGGPPVGLAARHRVRRLEIEQAGGQRAFAEWFNGKLQTECLNVYWFLSLQAEMRKLGLAEKLLRQGGCWLGEMV